MPARWTPARRARRGGGGGSPLFSPISTAPGWRAWGECLPSRQHAQVPCCPAPSPSFASSSFSPAVFGSVGRPAFHPLSFSTVDGVRRGRAAGQDQGPARWPRPAGEPAPIPPRGHRYRNRATKGLGAGGARRGGWGPPGAGRGEHPAPRAAVRLRVRGPAFRAEALNSQECPRAEGATDPRPPRPCPGVAMDTSEAPASGRRRAGLAALAAPAGAPPPPRRPPPTRGAGSRGPAPAAEPMGARAAGGRGGAAARWRRRGEGAG